MTSATFFTVPRGDRYALRNVRLPRALAPATLPPAPVEALVAADLLIDNGRIAEVAPAHSLDAGLGPDLDHSMVLPGLLDVHTHLDKGHIWPRRPNPSGDIDGALAATAADRVAHWNAEDVRRRMEFGLESAYARGVVAIRTHLDSLAPQADISFPVFREMRERWAGRIDLQATSLAPVDVFLTDEGRRLADLVADTGGQLGAVTCFAERSNIPLDPAFDAAMTNLFRLAAERDLDVDLHVDESTDPRIRTLIEVARIARREGFGNDILCGHCSSLALQDDDFIEATLDACVDAHIDVVTLPPVNMYLQSRGAGITPRWRGVTTVHEMKARGLRVAVAGDNCRDPFYAYGDHDMLDTYSQAVKILHLDHPMDDWITSATSIPADLMHLPERGRLQPGCPADLIVLRARSYSEMLSRFQADRVVLRNGAPIDTTPPDYRELDDLFADYHQTPA